MPFSTFDRRWSSEATGEPARVMGNFSEIIKLIFYVIERELPQMYRKLKKMLFYENLRSIHGNSRSQEKNLELRDGSSGGAGDY